MPENVKILKEVQGLPVISINTEIFKSNLNLKSITIPESITSIGKSAFSGCAGLNIFYKGSEKEWNNISGSKIISLENITVNFNKIKYQGIIYTLYDNYAEVSKCAYYSIENIDLLDEIDGLPVTRIGENAFKGCDGLVSIIIPDSVVSIGINAFEGTPWLNAKKEENPLVIINNILIDGTTCSGDIVIPYGVINIGNGAFYDFLGCKGLTSIEIPDSVTNIGDYAFYECSNLTSVIIPESLTEIRNYAFDYCESLTDIYYKGTEQQLQKVYIYEGNDVFYSAEIHYNYTDEDEIETIEAQPLAMDNIDIMAESAEQDGFVPNVVYNFYEFAEINVDDLLAPDNLIYVIQFTADENGNADIPHTPTDESQTLIVRGEELFAQPTLGDVNEDGFIDASDASAVLSEYAALATGSEGTFSENQKSAGDINSDGMIDANDASAILAFYSYLSTGGTENDMRVWLDM